MEEKEPGSAGFEKTGTLVVVPHDEYEIYLLQAVDLTLASGYHAEYWRDPAKIHEVVPDLNLEGILGAGWRPDDGFFDATKITNTLARWARERGVQILTGTEVTDIVYWLTARLSPGPAMAGSCPPLRRAI